MKEIDLEKILENCETYDPDYSNISIGDALDAMKEACKQVLELAAENTKLHHWSKNGHTLIASSKVDFDNYGGSKVDKQSILDTIKQVK